MAKSQVYFSGVDGTFTRPDKKNFCARAKREDQNVQRFGNCECKRHHNFYQSEVNPQVGVFTAYSKAKGVKDKTKPKTEMKTNKKGKK
ncbi:MAG: hypothetical protein ACOYPR_22735, partial [Saprospiraceae bacterium]